MHEAFRKEGAVVFGISGDSVESHKKFAIEHELPFTYYPTQATRSGTGMGPMG
jgi:peroxiredoxin